MRNRAKCKKCNDIVESYHEWDYVDCKCGEISVSGGAAMFCAAKDWANFVRVDDKDKEVAPKIVDEVKPVYIEGKNPNRDELIIELEQMIKNILGLPERAMTEPITHYDYASGLMLILSLFRSEDKKSV